MLRPPTLSATCSDRLLLAEQHGKQSVGKEIGVGEESASHSIKSDKESACPDGG